MAERHDRRAGGGGVPGSKDPGTPSGIDSELLEDTVEALSLLVHDLEQLAGQCDSDELRSRLLQSSLTIGGEQRFLVEVDVDVPSSAGHVDDLPGCIRPRTGRR